MKKNTPPLLGEESLESKLVKKGFWLYFFSYILGPIGYLIRIITSNSISIEEVGILYSMLGFVGLLSTYNGLGLTESLKYFIPKYYLKKQYNYIKTSLVRSLSIQILTSIVIIVILYFGADWIAVKHFHSVESADILKYLCIYFIGINIFQVLSSIFLSLQDTFNTKFTDFLKYSTILILAGILIFVDQGSMVKYAYIRIIGQIISVLAAIIVFVKKYRFIISKGKVVYDKKMLRPFRKYSLRTFISMNARVLLGMIDQQMVINLLGSKQAGYYTNYLSLLNIFNIIIKPIFWLLFPIFTEIFTKKNRKQLSLLQNVLYSYLGVFSLSLIGLCVAIGPEIASVLFGNEYLTSGYLFRTGAIFYILSILFSINFSILAGMGEVRGKTIIMLGVTILNIILNIILLKSIGIYGALISTVIGWFLLWFFSFRLVNKNCKISFDKPFVLKNLIILIVLTGILLITKEKILDIDANRWRNLLYIILIGIIWYSIIVVFNRKKIQILIKKNKKWINI